MTVKTLKTPRRKRLTAREMQEQKAELRERLIKNYFNSASAHDVLPSENELAEEFGFSLTVIRNLFNDLKSEDLIYSHKGKGLFLSEKYIEQKTFPLKKQLKIAIVCFIEKTHPDSVMSSANLILSAFERRGVKTNCQSKLFNLWPAFDFTLEMLQQLKKENVDAILFHDDAHVPSQQVLETLLLLDKPILSVLKPYPGVNSIIFNQAEVCQTATEHLLALGCKKLALLQYAGTSFWQLERKDMFNKLTQENNIKPLIFDIPDPETTDYHAYIQNSIFPIIQQEKVDGIYCSGDIFAAALIDAFKPTGTKIPDDVAIVGTDDCWQVREYDITTVQTDHTIIGEVAFKTLCELIKAPPSEPILKKVSCPLIRRSTA